MLTASGGLATLPAMDDRIDRELPEMLPREHVLGSRSRPDLSDVPSFLRRDDPTGTARSEAPVPRDRTNAGLERFVAVARQPSPVETPDPGAIPMATISPRRLLHAVAVVALAWGVISFGRQVATASAASAHADELRAANATLQGEVTAMQRELTLIQESRYVAQEARAYRLGSPNEIPFALQPGAPALSDDAPGSASNRLGTSDDAGGPVDTWLRILFGPG